MPQTFVLRLLDEQDTLLAWTRVQVRPTRGVCEQSATEFVLDAAGRAVKISVQWLDLDVERVERILIPFEITPEMVGRVGTYHWSGPLWKIATQDGVPLPPVTEKTSVAIGVPPGALGAVTSV